MLELASIYRRRCIARRSMGRACQSIEWLVGSLGGDADLMHGRTRRAFSNFYKFFGSKCVDLYRNLKKSGMERVDMLE